MCLTTISQPLTWLRHHYHLYPRTWPITLSLWSSFPSVQLSFICHGQKSFQRENLIIKPFSGSFALEVHSMPLLSHYWNFFLTLILLCLLSDLSAWNILIHTSLTSHPPRVSTCWFSAPWIGQLHPPPPPLPGHGWDVIRADTWSHVMLPMLVTPLHLLVSTSIPTAVLRTQWVMQKVQTIPSSSAFPTQWLTTEKAKVTNAKEFRLPLAPHSKPHVTSKISLALSSLEIIFKLVIYLKEKETNR